MEEITLNIVLFFANEKGVVFFISLTKTFIIASSGNVSACPDSVAFP